MTQFLRRHKKFSHGQKKIFFNFFQIKFYPQDNEDKFSVCTAFSEILDLSENALPELLPNICDVITFSHGRYKRKFLHIPTVQT